jgi:benzoyl-CoA reductase subunit BamC
MCEASPPLPQPICVQACKFGALTYEEREEEATESGAPDDEIEKGLQALTKKYGLQKVIDTVVEMSRKG